ncbi:ribonuclease P [Natronomonas gomsonensis]|jgi:ribonuclease P/MRP protein subunit RPP1|uniref:RNase P subunit p30 family protein n=1 Tax=Natronomonas gomsonensis TaxID=1046043 RepID=UPI0020CA63B1|nr:RNase P subunit p30 family protein [Natronomonas gomsonensis]MCY4729292.1 ribonuclease P [Natronomonas gomsonensis]
MYEGVHAHPDGEATVARLARTAAEYGYDGVVVRNHGDAQATYDPDRIESAYGIDVASGIEIRTDDAGQASGLIGNYRSKRDVVCVHGGDLNRFAVEQAKVDVLTHPMRDGDVNHVLAKAAAENGVHLEFNFGRVLRDDGGPRVQAIQGLRKLRELVDQYDVPYVVSADASSHLGLRGPRELLAVGATVGFDREAIEVGLSAWGDIVTTNRQRRSETFIEPGVRIEEHEEDA